MTLPAHDSTAARRASFYHLLGLAFDHPVPELHETMGDGEFQRTLWRTERAWSLQRSALPRLRHDFRAFESDYIALFELGPRGRSACSLCESAYGDDDDIDTPVRGSGGRAAVFESLLRFYHHFDLRLTDAPAERVLPDHLSCELEMLSFLCFREGQVLPDRAKVEPYRRAQRDFLARHIGRWLPDFVAALRARGHGGETARFYTAVADALLAGVTAHIEAYRDLPAAQGIAGDTHVRC